MTTINLLLTVTPDPLQVGGDRQCGGVAGVFAGKAPGNSVPHKKGLGEAEDSFTTPPLDAWTGGKVESPYHVGGQVLPDLQSRTTQRKMEEEVKREECTVRQICLVLTGSWVFVKEKTRICLP